MIVNITLQELGHLAQSLYSQHSQLTLMAAGMGCTLVCTD